MTPARVIPELTPHPGILEHVLLGVVLLSVFIANLVIFLLFQGTIVVISYFFYIPVVFTAFQYPRHGIFSSATLGLVYLGVVYAALDLTPVSVTTATVQFYVFVAVGTLVSHLSGELREHEIRYRGIFDHSQAGIMLVQRSDQRVLQVNQRCADLLGIRQEELAGRPLSSFWLDQEERERFLRNLGEGRTIADYESPLLVGGTAMRWMLLSAAPVSENLVVFTMVDISRRRESEEEIGRRNRELGVMNRIIAASSTLASPAEILQVAVEATRDFMGCEAGALYLLDPDRRTASLRHHAGLPAKHLPGLRSIPVQGTLLERAMETGTPICLHEPEEGLLPAWLDSFRTVAVIPLISSRGAVGFFIAGCSRPGPAFQESVRGVLASLGREVGGAVERVQLRHDLEEALKEVNLYLDIMVHDINNDTTAALGYGEMLREGLDREAAEQLTRVLSRISHSAEIISDVSTIRQIRRKSSVLRKIPLEPVIRQEIRHFPDAEIRFPGTGLAVCADDLIPVIFTNLLSNSVKYGGPGVRIEVEAREDGGWAEITVRDNGPGIDPALRSHLFERFSHGQAKKSGMGLGLYITRMLVERYGGTIRVDEPAGTQERPGFSVTLRLRLPSAGQEGCRETAR